MRKIKHISLFVPAALALALLPVACVREKLDYPDGGYRRPAAPLNLDDISISAATGNVALDADKLEYDVTVHHSESHQTKAAMQNPDSVRTAVVELTSYKGGKNPEMSIYGPVNSTKALYDQVTTRDLNSNFLRLDETVGTNNLATYEWQTWDNAKMLEANVIATPDNTDNLYYRTVTFNPQQSYESRPFNNDEVTGNPQDTIFYHTRMVAWYPMICPVPDGEHGKMDIQFKDNRYSQNRREITTTRVGVVFDHKLNGATDVMMSNMCEAQRYHRNFGSGNYAGREGFPTTIVGTTPTPHYRDEGKSLPEAQEHYHFPFGHNEKNPTYSNPMFYHHYLSAIRIWAKVDQTGDAAALNLMTWGKIKAVSVVNQPSTVTIALPDRVSSAVSQDEYGNINMQDGKIVFDESQLVFGEPFEWTDYTNLPLQTDLMFGEGDINHKDDQEVSYPIDMVKATDVHGMDAVYLGYCLVKPCAPYGEGEEPESITLAIQTEGGTYQAVIPCKAIIRDGHSAEPVHVFDESKVYDITLNLKTSGTFTDFVGEEDQNKYIDLSPYDETNGNYKTANSYIVSAEEVQDRINGGETAPGYTFVGNIIGNGELGIIRTHGSQTFHVDNSIIKDASRAAIVWQSNQNQIYDVQYTHSYIRFLVRDATPGNAVIAITDDAGNVKWSWHIWIAEDEPQTVNVGGVNFMDRNLGALWHGTSPIDPDQKIKSYGLYYQWGRKDPLPGPAEWDQTESTDISPIYDEYGMEITDLGAYVFDQSNTIQDAVEHPMHYALCPFNPFYAHDWMANSLDFLWGETSSSGTTSKTIYDPCPFGYRIVHGELQNVLESPSAGVSATDGSGLLVNGSLYLPYAGYFGPDRNNSSNTNASYYMGSKGDYINGLVCPPGDAQANTYFSGHRLRTYISQATSWTEENTDGQTAFQYTASSHYVETSIASKRDYTNRKTAGSVRCVADESYVKAAYAHIKHLTHTLEAGGTVKLDLNGGVNLGAIKNAWLKISYMDGGGSTHDSTINFVVNGTITTDQFLDKFDGTYNKLAIKGMYEHKLPDTLPTDKYTFTFYVEEEGGSTKEESCAVSTTGITTQNIVTTVGTNTDGKHPYAGESFSVTATLEAGPCTDITVSSGNFKLSVGGNEFTASSATAVETAGKDGFYTITVTYNNVHIDAASLSEKLEFSGKVTLELDGEEEVEFDWDDSITTEVWQKTADNRYIDPHIAAGTFSKSGSNLYKDEGDYYPVVGRSFSAAYADVVVSDADAVSVTSAKIGGFNATANVTNNLDGTFTVRVETPADAITLNDWKRGVPVPVEINFSISSTALGLTNASVKQIYPQTLDVYKFVPDGRLLGSQLTTLTDVSSAANREKGVLMVHSSYDTDANRRFVKDNSGTLSMATSLAPGDDSVLWVLSGTTDNYTLMSKTGKYLTLSGQNKNHLNPPSLNAEECSLKLNGNGNFSISKYITNGDGYFVYNGSFTSTSTSSSNWRFYTYTDSTTGHYDKPTEDY